jgi:hypothetical protein
MFYTLQITIQQKYDGHFPKSYKHFMQAFKDFQQECKNDNKSQLNKINCRYLGVNNRAYLIFINTDYRTLKIIKNEVIKLIDISQTQYNEILNVECVFGKIINSNYVEKPFKR